MTANWTNGVCGGGLSRHARRRMGERGLRMRDVMLLLAEADCETAVGGGCTALMCQGSIARAIEMNLLNTDAEDRLDTVLFETVARRVEAAQHHYRSGSQERNGRIESLLKSWESL